jgi:glyoxylase I family protein
MKPACQRTEKGRGFYLKSPKDSTRESTLVPAVHGHHHLAIQVKDLPRAERFYADVLGLEVVRRWPREDGPGERSVWMSVGAGEEFLALEACEVASPPATFRDPRAGLHLVALRIQAVERGAWEERLAARGVEIVHRTPFTLYLRDPEGNRIGLSHFPHRT